MQTEPTARITIFASYAPQDTLLQGELKEHLRPLQREGMIELWPDRDMSAGTDWEQQSSELLQAAQIILLLVSIDYLNSDYCSGIEMRQALDRHERGEVRLVPILLRPCLWNTSPLRKLQVLPSKGQPVTTWANREAAWLDVVQLLRQVVDHLLQRPKDLSQMQAARKPNYYPGYYLMMHNNLGSILIENHNVDSQFDSQHH